MPPRPRYPMFDFFREALESDELEKGMEKKAYTLRRGSNAILSIRGKIAIYNKFTHHFPVGRIQLPDPSSSCAPRLAVLQMLPHLTGLL